MLDWGEGGFLFNVIYPETTSRSSSSKRRRRSRLTFRYCCCSWCCESGRQKVRLTIRLFHYTRVASYHLHNPIPRCGWFALKSPLSPLEVERIFLPSSSESEDVDCFRSVQILQNGWTTIQRQESSIASPFIQKNTSQTRGSLTPNKFHRNDCFLQSQIIGVGNWWKRNGGVPLIACVFIKFICRPSLGSLQH